METKGGGYVVIYITSTFLQSLRDGKDHSLSAKEVWNSGTTFLNRLCMISYSTHSIIGFIQKLFCLAMELKQTSRLRSNCTSSFLD